MSGKYKGMALRCVFGLIVAMTITGVAFGSDFIVTMKPDAIPAVKGMSLTSNAGRKLFATSVMKAASVAASAAGGSAVEVFENLVDKNGRVKVHMKTDGDEVMFTEILAKDPMVSGVSKVVKLYGTMSLDGGGIVLSGQGGSALNAVEGNFTVAGNKDSVVYVLDTGVDMTNSQLASIVDATNSRNYTSETPESGHVAFQDYNGHGSHVSGVIAGVEGIRGVAKGAKVRAIKILDKNNIGNTLFAIRFMNEIMGDTSFPGVRIINISLVGFNAIDPDSLDRNYPSGVDVFYDTIRQVAETNKYLFVNAAGNDNLPVGEAMVADDPEGRWNAGDYVIPGSYKGIKNLIVVGSMNHHWKKASKFSNWSPDKVDFQAPGEEIRSFWSKTAVREPSEIGNASGTSMSAPFVSGIALSVSATDRTLSAGKIVDILRANVMGTPYMKDGKAVCKYGTPSMKRAVKAAGGMVPDFDDVPSDEPTPNPTGDFVIDFDKAPEHEAFAGQPIDASWNSNSKWSLSLGAMIEPETSNDVGGREVKVFTTLRPIEKPLSKFEFVVSGFKKVGRTTTIEVRNDAGEWIDDSNLVFKHGKSGLSYEYRVTFEGRVSGSFYDVVDPSVKVDEPYRFTEGSIRGMNWVRQGDSGQTKVKFSGAGLKVIDMPGAPSKKEHDSSLTGGGGCDAGVGLGGVALIGLAMLVNRRKNAA